MPLYLGYYNQTARRDFIRLTVPDIGGLQGTRHLSQTILALFDGSAEYDLIFRIAEAGRDDNGKPRNASTVKRRGPMNGSLPWTTIM